MSPDNLFKYADKFARKKESLGLGTQYPTMRQAAKRFKCSLDDIEDACNCYSGDGYLGIACAVGISGVGYAAIEPRGSYLVEAYK